MNNWRGEFCLRNDKTKMNFVVPIVVILHVIAVTPNVLRLRAVGDLEPIYCQPNVM